MRAIFFLGTVVSTVAFAKMSINPSSISLLPNQCFVLTVHFSEATASVRKINVSSDHPGVRVFASSDCSGVPTVTVSGSLRSFSFSVLPDAAIASGKYSVVVDSTTQKRSESARAKVSVP